MKIARHCAAPLAFVLALALAVFLPGTVMGEEPKGEPQGLDRLLESVGEAPAGWEAAVEAVARSGEPVDPGRLAAELERLAGEAKAAPSPPDRLKAQALARLARRQGAVVAVPVLREIALAAVLPEDLRYESARALAALAPGLAPELLASGADPVMAGVLDQLGDAGEPAVARAVTALRRDHDRYQATLTGDALTRLRLADDYAAHWRAHRTFEERLAFLVPRVGEMYTITPPPGRPVLRDDPVGRRLAAALRELWAERPQQLAAAFEAAIEKGAVNADYLRLALAELRQ
jgi:hypothetical protein